MLGCHTVKVWLKNSRATRKVGDRLGVGQNTETVVGVNDPHGGHRRVCEGGVRQGMVPYHFLS